VLTIKRAQALGFKLAEIRDLLRGARAGRVSERATRKLEEIDASISHLQKTREELARLVEYRCDHLVGCSCGQADCPVRTIPAIANDQPALRLGPGRAEKRAGLLAAGSAVAACAVCCAPLVAAALTYLGVSALVATESAGIGLGAALDGAEIERAHRPDIAEMVRLVGHRGDVDDNEALDLRAMSERQHHRHLAAHAVPEEGKAGMARCVQPRPDILGHLGIIHRVGPGRRAVIAQVERPHMKFLRQIAPRRLPVARRAEHSVQQHERWMIRAAEISMKKFYHAAHEKRESRLRARPGLRGETLPATNATIRPDPSAIPS